MNYKQLLKQINDYKAKGKTLPCVGENSDGEVVVVSEGSECGEHYINLATAQHNNFMRNNVYWANGTTEEYFE